MTPRGPLNAHPNSARSAVLAAVMFFILALAISTFLCGDIGVYNDDWFCNQRDPVTHEAHDFVMNRPWHLWRPLTRVILIPLTTALWPHPWALHLISAVLHGGIVALFYLFLRRVNIRAALAGPIALAFMLYPAHFEAVLWIDIICTLMAMVLVLGIWNVYATWLAHAHQRSGLQRFITLIGLGVAAWCSAAMNEQPAGTLAALPLLPLAIGLVPGLTMRQRVVRSAMPVLAVSIGLLLYLRGFLHHSDHAHPQTIHDRLTLLTHNLAELSTKIPRELRLKNVALGAMQQGWEAAAAHPARAAILSAALLACALWWFTQRPRLIVAAVDEPRRTRWIMLAALGGVWFAAAWLPVAAAHAVTSPRLHYPPAPGLGLILAAILSPIAAAISRRALPTQRVIRTTACIAMLPIILASLAMWVGIQSNFRRRYEADKAEIAPLVSALATTVPPHTYFVPVRVVSQTCKTLSPRLDAYFAHCWTWEFASGWRLQYDMRRDDIHTFMTYTGIAPQGLYLDDADPGHAVMMLAAPAPPFPRDRSKIPPKIPGMRGFRRLPIDRCVFFETPKLGETHLYTKIRLHLPDGSTVITPSAPLAGSPAIPTLPERILDLSPMPEAARAAVLARSHRPINSSAGTSAAPRPQ